jgi:site-specific DNA-methyltransferase (cytosine-N4-specific)
METNIVYNETCLETCKRLPNESVDCIITSPPYWQLRDYGYPEQWGLEPTFNEYLEHLWTLMDEIHRILKPSGTVWINLGDTYNGNTVGNRSNKGYNENTIVDTFRKNKIEAIKNKCLLLIPHRFAIGCIDRGWIVRNDIIWAKRNGMPESVTDRFSKKHEYFFFMVKSEKYFFDLDAIRDKHSESSIKRIEYGFKSNHDSIGNIDTDRMGERSCNPKGKNPGSVSDFWDIPTKPNKDKHYAQYSDSLISKPILAGCPEGGIIYDPFMGSGSTADAAIRTNRKFIGSEASKEYYDLCSKRIGWQLLQHSLF